MIVPPQGHRDSYVSQCSPFHNKKKLVQPYEGKLTDVEISFGVFSKFKCVFKVQEVVQGETCASVVPKLKTNLNFIGDQSELLQAIHGRC